MKSRAALIERWEARLRREGLAPLQEYFERERAARAQITIRPQIITPRRSYVPDAERLAAALEAWCHGDTSVFNAAGNAKLSRFPQYVSPSWSGLFVHNRARRLARICRALVTGCTVHEAMRSPGDDDIAYKFLRPLFACLAETSAQVDDEQHDRSGEDD